MELQLNQIVLDADRQQWQSSIQQDLVISRETVELEAKLAEYVGAQHCLCVESATAGLMLALKAAGIVPGDVVLCTSFSYFATGRIIELLGATPMYVDINPNTFSVDPYCLEYLIGKCKRTKQPIPKALIAVDLFGLPCNYTALEAICQQYEITLIEDMSMSFGASYKGKRAGSFGRIAVASFFPSRPISELGEGGAVFCHAQKDMQRLQALRRKIRLHCDSDIVGGGSYLDTIQASVAVEKLALLDGELRARQGVAGRYVNRLRGSVKTQLVGEGFSSAYNQFAILLKSFEVRERVMAYLRDKDIPCSVFDPSPVRGDRQGAAWDRVALVNTQSVAQRILTLPMHPYLSTRVVDYICDHLLAAALS